MLNNHLPKNAQSFYIDLYYQDDVGFSNDNVVLSFSLHYICLNQQEYIVMKICFILYVL